MPREKKYRYKIWLEVERVEVDKFDNDKADPERGMDFGFIPVDIYETHSLTELETTFQTYEKIAESFHRSKTVPGS